MLKFYAKMVYLSLQNTRVFLRKTLIQYFKDYSILLNGHYPMCKAILCELSIYEFVIY